MPTQKDLHAEFIEYLKSHNIISKEDSWESSGSLMVIKGMGLIEIKAKDSQDAVKSAYQEILTYIKKEPWANLSFFAILTPKSIWVYQKTKEKPIPSWQEPTAKWRYPQEKPQFLHFLQNPKQKVPLDLFYPQVLSHLYSQKESDSLSVLLFLLHFKEPLTFSKEGVFLSQDTPAERFIACDENTQEYIKNLSCQYQLENSERLKEILRHDFSHYQSDSKKSSLGKYYTPSHLVNLVKEQSRLFLEKHPHAIVLDSAAGCGAFLEAYKDYHILGRDIDKQSVLILKELGYKNIQNENSLLYNTRAHYNIAPNAPLLIVGNPPYNDTTSKNKRTGSHKKEKQTVEMLDAFKSNDYGLCFLKHYASLSPDEIVVLHPLSYLTKKAHIRKLQEFFKHYKLVKGLIFSSSEFGEALKNHKTPFPIVCAHYKKGSMEEKTLLSFPFVLWDKENPENLKPIIFSNLPTIDDIPIRKYPPTKNMPKDSDIGLYHYHIRDANSLKTSGNITQKPSVHTIPIQFANLWQYAYLQAYRRYALVPYYLGNTSPLADQKLLQDEVFRDVLVMDLLLQNQRLECCNVKNEHSFLYTHFLMDDFRPKMDKNPLYQSFLSFCEGNASISDVQKDFAAFLTPQFTKMTNPQTGAW